MAASDIPKDFKPDHIKVSYITQDVQFGKQNTWSAMCFLSQTGIATSLGKTITIIVYRSGEVKYSLQDVIDLINHNSIRKAKDLIARLKSMNLLPSVHAMLDIATIEDILTKVNELGLDDYSLILNSKVLHIIDANVRQKSKQNHTDLLKRSLPFLAGDAMKISAAIEAHQDYIDKSVAFNIEDYPEIKKMMDVLNTFFTPHQTNKRLRN